MLFRSYKDSAEQAAFCARQAEEAETAGADQALQEAMDQAAKASSASDYYQERSEAIYSYPCPIFSNLR